MHPESLFFLWNSLAFLSRHRAYKIVAVIKILTTLEIRIYLKIERLSTELNKLTKIKTNNFWEREVNKKMVDILLTQPKENTLHFGKDQKPIATNLYWAYNLLLVEN